MIQLNKINVKKYIGAFQWDGNESYCTITSFVYDNQLLTIMNKRKNSYYAIFFDLKNMKMIYISL